GVAPVVRALDEAGLVVESLELVQPSLDDVFVAKTGYHLEGAETGEQEAQPAGDPAARGREPEHAAGPDS
ncbi:MAG: hypothetical protein ACRDL3_01410, partial [Solirubrobacterales bacterium]